MVSFFSLESAGIECGGAVYLAGVDSPRRAGQSWFAGLPAHNGVQVVHSFVLTAHLIVVVVATLASFSCCLGGNHDDGSPDFVIPSIQVITPTSGAHLLHRVITFSFRNFKIII